MKYQFRQMQDRLEDLEDSHRGAVQKMRMTFDSINDHLDKLEPLLVRMDQLTSEFSPELREKDTMWRKNPWC